MSDADVQGDSEREAAIVRLMEVSPGSTREEIEKAYDEVSAVFAALSGVRNEVLVRVVHGDVGMGKSSFLPVIHRMSDLQQEGVPNIREYLPSGWTFVARGDGTFDIIDGDTVVASGIKVNVI